MVTLTQCIEHRPGYNIAMLLEQGRKFPWTIPIIWLEYGLVCGCESHGSVAGRHIMGRWYRPDGGGGGREAAEKGEKHDTATRWAFMDEKGIRRVEKNSSELRVLHLPITLSLRNSAKRLRGRQEKQSGEGLKDDQHRHRRRSSPGAAMWLHVWSMRHKLYLTAATSSNRSGGRLRDTESHSFCVIYHKGINHGPNGHLIVGAGQFMLLQLSGLSLIGEGFIS